MGPRLTDNRRDQLYCYILLLFYVDLYRFFQLVLFIAFYKRFKSLNGKARQKTFIHFFWGEYV